MLIWTWVHILQGAYTGVCSAQHVPSYKSNIDKFKAKGIDSVICVAVNDPYVLNGWAEKLEAKEAVSHFLSFPIHLRKIGICLWCGVLLCSTVRVGLSRTLDSSTWPR